MKMKSNCGNDEAHSRDGPSTVLRNEKHSVDKSERPISKHVFLSQSQQLLFHFYRINCQIKAMAQDVTGFLVCGSLLCKLFFCLMTVYEL